MSEQSVACAPSQIGAPLEARPSEDYFQPAASQLPFPSIRRVTKIDVASVHPVPRPGAEKGPLTFESGPVLQDDFLRLGLPNYGAVAEVVAAEFFGTAPPPSVPQDLLIIPARMRIRKRLTPSDS